MKFYKNAHLKNFEIIDKCNFYKFYFYNYLLYFFMALNLSDYYIHTHRNMNAFLQLRYNNKLL